MRRAITSANISIPNDRLVIVHVTNFAVWCALGAFATVLYFLEGKLDSPTGNNRIEFSYNIFSTVTYLFEIYMNMFLLYLITRFASENKNAETRDPILGRKVPNIVFL